MRVHAATPEGNRFAETPFQFGSVHIPGVSLHRIEAIHARVDQIREQGDDTAVGVIENGCFAIVMDGLEQGFVAG